MSVVGYQARNHPQQTARRGSRPDVDDRATPPEVFAPLAERFGFTIDSCATPANARLPRFWTAEDDALAQPWAGERIWCNPRGEDLPVPLQRCVLCKQRKPADAQHFEPCPKKPRGWSARCLECIRTAPPPRQDRWTGGHGNRRPAGEVWERKCSGCTNWQPEDADHFGTKKERGITYWNSICRSCARERARERMRERRADPATAGSVRDSRNRHRQSPQGREWRRARMAIDNAIRRQRLTSAPQTLTPEEWTAVCACFGGGCAYCGSRSGRMELDHVIPVSADDFPGTLVGNVLPACRSCNRSKGYRRVEEWRPALVPLLPDMLARASAACSLEEAA